MQVYTGLPHLGKPGKSGEIGNLGEKWGKSTWRKWGKTLQPKVIIFVSKINCDPQSTNILQTEILVEKTVEKIVKHWGKSGVFCLSK